MELTLIDKREFFMLGVGRGTPYRVWHIDKCMHIGAQSNDPEPIRRVIYVDAVPSPMCPDCLRRLSPLIQRNV